MELSWLRCGLSFSFLSSFGFPSQLFAYILSLLVYTCLASKKGFPPEGLVRFRTEPQLSSPVVKVDVRGPTRLISPGYIFIDPIYNGLGLGPHIYDSYGNLIWSGNGVLHNYTLRTQATHVCNYKGSEGGHICYNEVHSDQLSKVACYNRVIDDTYTPTAVRSYGKLGGWAWPNPHEINLVDSGYSILRLIYQQRLVDLTNFNGASHTYVDDGCFQEVDIHGRENFRWCTLDHADLSETYNLEQVNAPHLANDRPNKYPIGSPEHPWSGVHINAVDKTPEGDYLVSNRHFGSILKVAGSFHSNPGSIIWRAGGRNSTFTVKDGHARFNGQHNVRYVRSDAEGEVFTLFDNTHGGGEPPARRVSAGKLLRVDNATGTLSLLASWPHPDGLVCGEQGSMQLIASTGNAFVGWGARPHFTEFTAAGAPLVHGVIGAWDVPPAEQAMFNYRVSKGPWAASPRWGPKLLAYSRGCAGAAVAYVSWNGATEVRSWRFYVGAAPELVGDSHRWVQVGTRRKVMFETRAVLRTTLLGAFAAVVSVEALDARGQILARVQNRTFVPRSQLVLSGVCDYEGCPIGFLYDVEDSRADTCRPSMIPSLMALTLVVVAIEWGVQMVMRLMDGELETKMRVRRVKKESFDE